MLYEVIIDSGETANKCTIAPLASRPDFRLYPAKGNRSFGPLSSDILLHHEGECLTEIKRQISSKTVHGIASIDCVWRRLETLQRRIALPAPLLARIPQGFATAYPRQSKFDFDPDAGLATIEAIFVAAALLGNWDVSLFSYYYFGRKFVEINRERFLELGVAQAGDESAMPQVLRRLKTSKQRRQDRGHFIAT